jgi:NAD+ kinase
MAAEPARISEFSVAGPGGEIARFRADGVVASTPAGSDGYNRRAGGPVVAPGTGVASVVPIAPFSTSGGHWVLPIESVALAVERDETPVELLVDGRRERRVAPGDPLELSVAGVFETYALPEGE